VAVFIPASFGRSGSFRGGLLFGYGIYVLLYRNGFMLLLKSSKCKLSVLNQLQRSVDFINAIKLRNKGTLQ
jgi:hypothetical protein